MPQLNPGPWMLIWLSSWVIFLFTIPPLMISFKPSNSPTKSQILNPLDSWHWPWP
uniref:ATP synthase complex subunit 8 n=1 Tax=Cynoglossus nanhaiensis TaxID=2213132 RepID=A0A7L7S225_9PLEU|nr:ATP synthase F0 subunit 8 [Cynoglossus nanhaiensis]AWQ65111.1 ATP synthase subunit-8 [Cynoglossus nanhaiensis]QNV46917.1 ATP synthase F0 subunit 8 [Cynoglossus nanhaiensis]